MTIPNIHKDKYIAHQSSFQLTLIKASLKDYPIIQNMARFYVYDLSRSCGFVSDDWSCPADGLYECNDLKSYFDDPTRIAYLIKIGEELAGFVLLNKVGTEPSIDWNMGEFFILAKFQTRGFGKLIAYEIWKLHPGQWEVSVIPENIPALSFWRKTIATFTETHYNEEIKTVDYDTQQKNRYIFSFNT